MKMRDFWAYRVESVEDTPSINTGGSEQDEDSDDINWDALVPDNLKTKEYFQNILKAKNPGKELVLQFDNAQQLIGKKTIGIPDINAKDEDWNVFYNNLRPAEATEYELPPLDLGADKKDVADYMNGRRDVDLMKEVKEIAHKHGLSKKQFSSFVADYEKAVSNRVEKQLQIQKDNMAQFLAVVDKTFGGQKDKAIQYGRDFVNEFASDASKQHVSTLSDDAFIVLADMAHTFNRKYKKADTVNLENIPTHTGKSLDGLEAELHRLTALPSFRDPHASDHKIIQQQRADIISQIVHLKKQK